MSQVFGAICQAVQRAPYYPESHNLKGLIFEARRDYQSAVASYRVARHVISGLSGALQQSCMRDVTVNLARSLSKVNRLNMLFSSHKPLLLSLFPSHFFGGKFLSFSAGRECSRCSKRM